MTAYEQHEIRLGEEGYPRQLALSPRPPEKLYVAGDPARLVEGLGVVGARRATPYGLAAAKLFAGWAAAEGVVIVSGAAFGCDHAGQQAAVDEGGSSVAVLGCGADVDYPSSSATLLAHLRRHAAVVSELPWGTPPLRWAFRERNRIIAGLSAALLVVEAGLPSGTFSTADFALDAGRPVFAVPGSILAPECRGPNRLIRQGAAPVTDVSDLAFELRGCGLLADTTGSGSLMSTAPDPIGRALAANPMRPDDVARTFAMDIVAVMRRIAALEASGAVMRYRDGRYGARPREEVKRREATETTGSS